MAHYTLYSMLAALLNVDENQNQSENNNEWTNERTSKKKRKHETETEKKNLVNILHIYYTSYFSLKKQISFSLASANAHAQTHTQTQSKQITSQQLMRTLRMAADSTQVFVNLFSNCCCICCWCYFILWKKPPTIIRYISS